MNKVFVCFMLILGFGLCAMGFVKFDVCNKNLLDFGAKEICLVLKANNYAKKSCKEIRRVSNQDKLFLYFEDLSEEEIKFFDFDYLEITYERDVNYFLKKFGIRIIVKDMIDEKEMFYGYSPYFKNSICFNGFKVNFQIVIFDGCFKVGYPFIYSSY